MRERHPAELAARGRRGSRRSWIGLALVCAWLCGPGWEASHAVEHLLEHRRAHAHDDAHARSHPHAHAHAHVHPHAHPHADEHAGGQHAHVGGAHAHPVLPLPAGAQGLTSTHGHAHLETLAVVSTRSFAPDLSPGLAASVELVWPPGRSRLESGSRGIAPESRRPRARARPRAPPIA